MLRALAVLAVAVALAGPASAQVKCAEELPPVDRDAESRMSAHDFVHDVAAKEAAFAKALGSFGYTTEATVQTLTGDAVDGEFRQVSTLGFDANGPKREVADGAGNTPIAPMRFEVVRALVGEQYWFPVTIRADEDPRIGDQTVHVRVTVKYSNYKAR